MRKVEQIVIHCAATPNGKHFTIEDIDAWHKERGFRRQEHARQKHRPELLSVGYHFVIYTDGTVAQGRDVEEIGAHAAGHNAASIGVCLIGMDKFTPAQWESLAILLNALWSMYPGAEVIGHRDLPEVKKSCPGFDVAWFVGNDLKPHTDRILA